MSKITKEKVISDARDAVIEVSGDSSPITYGGETGLAARIRQLTATSGTIDITYNGEYDVKEYNSANVHISLPSGTTTITENGTHNVRSFIYADINVPQAKLDYVATFKVENEDYYFASCQQGGYITAPVEPTITSGSFNGWKIGSTVVSFPYEPSGDIEIVADIVGPTPSSYTIPFEIPASWYQDIDLGGETAPIIARSENINNIVVGNNYQLTIYDMENNPYTAIAQAEELEGLIQIGFEFENSGLPEEISNLIYGTQKLISIVNGFTVEFIPGDGFILYITVPTVPTTPTAEDMKAAISKFYLEEVVTPSR